jgi:hypothetical protein
MIGRRAILLGCIAGCALAGCSTVDRFNTKPGEAYCGSIVSASFVRDGQYPPDMRMGVTLDMDKLSTTPGTITTDDTLCPKGPLFKNVKMRALQELLNDPLSLMQFGEGRVYNFFAWVDSDCQGTMLVVVSLMSDDNVEVRLLKPEPASATGHSGFAVFQLSRHEGGCGF